MSKSVRLIASGLVEWSVTMPAWPESFMAADGAESFADRYEESVMQMADVFQGVVLLAERKGLDASPFVPIAESIMSADDTLRDMVDAGASVADVGKKWRELQTTIAEEVVEILGSL